MAAGAELGRRIGVGRTGLLVLVRHIARNMPFRITKRGARLRPRIVSEQTADPRGRPSGPVRPPPATWSAVPQCVAGVTDQLARTVPSRKQGRLAQGSGELEANKDMPSGRAAAARRAVFCAVGTVSRTEYSARKWVLCDGLTLPPWLGRQAAHAAGN